MVTFEFRKHLNISEIKKKISFSQKKKMLLVILEYKLGYRKYAYNI